MLALPLDRVELFERRLELTWSTSRSWFKRRDALALGLGLCGLRSIEIRRLVRRDVGWVDAVVHVRTAKGGCPRTVPVGLSWMEAARRLIADNHWRFAESEADRQGWVFVARNGAQLSYRYLLERCRAWCREVFGRPFSLHCLRHTCAVRVYLQTRDVLAVHRLLGHRNLQWTETYLAGLVPQGVDGLPSFVVPDRPRLKLFDPDRMLGRRSVG